MNRRSEGRRLPVRRLLAALAVPALLALSAPLAASADQPIITVASPSSGAATSPASASAAASSGGQTNLCLNGQQSQVDPTASTPTGVLQIDTSTCTAAGSAGSSATSGASGAGAGAPESHVVSGSSAQTTTSVVEAADASQLRIDVIRFTTSRVRAAKKLGLVVTVRGQQGSLVQGGIVSINGVPGAKLACACRRVTFSNKLGQAAFTVPVSRSMLGKRLYLQVTARTSTLQASRLVSVRLP